MEAVRCSPGPPRRPAPSEVACDHQPLAVPTPYHTAFWAHALSINDSSGAVADLSRSIANARVDLNPHQVDAALFAIRSPLSKGVILADEVGLGKTIEAGRYA